MVCIQRNITQSFKKTIAICNNMDGPGVLCLIKQRKTNTVCFHLYEEFFK